jgi:hypothetical protein
MATQIQYRRGTNAQNSAFTGALAEITVDTTNGTLRVHDGITAGGSNIATVAYVTGQISALSSNSISSGTSNVRVFANGNVTTSAAGTANVLVVTSTGALITGDLSVTGNATLSGNILGDRIQNGTTTIDIQTPNGNANVTVGGTSNVAVFATTGVFVTGINSVTGNITGGNISATNHTGTTVSVTGTVTGASVVGGVMTGSSVSVTGNITGGNLSGTNIVGTLTTAAQTNITSVGTLSALSVTGNVQGGNLRTAGLISASGSITGASVVGGVMTGSSVSVTGAVTGASVVGGVMTGSSVSVTGAITGAALTGTSLTVSTGNITGGNLLLSGAIIDSAQLDIQTSAANANIALAPNGTGVVTVSTQVSAVGNVTGGNIRTAGLISATGNITTAGQFIGAGTGLTGTAASLTVGTATVAGTVTTAAQPNITSVGTMSTATITTLSTSAITKTGSNGVGNIGQSDNSFNTVFAKATSAQYADLAEKYVADADYESGTVVIFGGTVEVTISSVNADPRVAGVVSTNPAFIMNDTLQAVHMVTVALQGRVPTRVIGSVKKGDRMVTSHIAGVSTILDTSKYEPGCIIGKALQDHEPTYDNDGNEIIGTIEVVVGRV